MVWKADFELVNETTAEVIFTTGDEPSRRVTEKWLDHARMDYLKEAMWQEQTRFSTRSSE